MEDHLAAEGRELPKEIFEDFTTQWVNEASSLAKRKEGGPGGASGGGAGLVRLLLN